MKKHAIFVRQFGGVSHRDNSILPNYILRGDHGGDLAAKIHFLLKSAWRKLGKASK